MAGATRWRPYEGRNIVGYYEFAIFRGGRIETGIVNYSVIIAGRIEVAPKLQKSKLLLRSSFSSLPVNLGPDTSFFEDRGGSSRLCHPSPSASANWAFLFFADANSLSKWKISL